MLEKVGPLDAGDVSAAAILPRLLMGRRVPDEVAERACREYDVILSDHDLSAEEVIRISTEQGSAALLAGSRNGLTAKTIAALPNSLRIIANPSAGFDHMDVAAAKARG